MPNNGDVVAVGEVEGFTINVLYRHSMDETFYVWTATNDGKIHKTDGRDYPTIDRAIHAAIEYFIPGAEHVELPSPNSRDYEALNALLYVGGQNFDLETIEDVAELRTMLAEARDAIQAVKAKAAKDLERARLIIASTHGAFHEAALNVSSVNGVFGAQCDVLEQITVRSIETIDAFLDHLK